MHPGLNEPGCWLRLVHLRKAAALALVGWEGAYMDLAKNENGHGWNKCMEGGTGGRNRSIGTDYLSE